MAEIQQDDARQSDERVNPSKGDLVRRASRSSPRPQTPIMMKVGTSASSCKKYIRKISSAMNAPRMPVISNSRMANSFARLDFACTARGGKGHEAAHQHHHRPHAIHAKMKINL